jgi:hypothetical protein
MTVKMTKTNVEKFEKAFLKFAASVEEKTGVKIDLSRATTDGRQMKFNVTITPVAEDGKKVLSWSEQTFVNFAKIFGVSPDILGQTFMTDRGTVKVLGMREGKATKNTISIEYNGNPKYVTNWPLLRSQLLGNPSMKKYVDESVKVEPIFRTRRRRSFADMF